MENMVMKRMNLKIIRLIGSLRCNHAETKPSPSSTENIEKKKKECHPYRKIHPWRSRIEFCRSMAESVLYNQDGLVAINKPYGISAQLPADTSQLHKHPSGIPNEVNYTITDALPEIASILGHESLRIVKTPEKFTSGIVLLASNGKVEKAVLKALRRTEGIETFGRTYWTVTRTIPKFPQGSAHVAMSLKRTPEQRKPVPIIIEKWSKNARERGDIKILNVQYKVLCCGTQDLSALLEIKSSTTRWHAVRLFASTFLWSPILGDRIYGSRVVPVMGKWVMASPVVDAAHVPPKLDPELLKLLEIGKNQEGMIPVHMHLREMLLPSFLRKGDDVSIKAPLFPEFLWSWNKLGFDEALVENEAKMYIPLETRDEET